MERRAEEPPWTQTVALMRSDVARLGDEPSNAWRLPVRLFAAWNGLALKLAATNGVSSRELSALLTLWDGGRCTMSELADRIGMSRAAMTTMVDRLEAVGLLERVPDPSDRRRVLVMITPKVDSLLRAAFAPLADTTASLATTDAWAPFADAAAQLRDLASTVAAAIELPDSSKRDTAELPRKRGPKPKPTYW